MCCKVTKHFADVQVLIDKAEHPQRKRIAQHIMHFFVYFAQQNVHFFAFFTQLNVHLTHACKKKIAHSERE